MNLKAMTLRELMLLNQQVAAEIANRVLGDPSQSVSLTGSKLVFDKKTGTVHAGNRDTGIKPQEH